MRCLSCGVEMTSHTAKLFQGRVLLCSKTCLPLAEAASKQIEVTIRQAEAQAKDWLEQHILSGGLLRSAENPPKGS